MITRRIILSVIAIGVVGVAIWAIQRFAPAPLRPSGTITAGNKELVKPSGFINTAPFTVASLLGKKVILVDFWTYSCINCIRTLPYLNDWYAKYKDKGLVIIGMHTPEFEFEKNIDNVRTAVQKFGIKYPVVLDNDYGTWSAYGNQYWPHEYLIGLDGTIVHDHIGEGGYDETEAAIQKALNAPHTAITPPKNAPQIDFSKVLTPELYLGTQRNSGALGKGANQVDLIGEWKFTPEYAQCVSGCRLRLRYSARQVNLVAGADKPVQVMIMRDDVSAGGVVISGQMLYTLIDDPAYGEHQLELEVGPGVQIFTLTFG